MPLHKRENEQFHSSVPAGAFDVEKSRLKALFAQKLF